MLYIGTAGWSIPRPVGERFAGEGSHLERYARVFRCAEINSTFKHEHRASTYARWAAATPPGFRFAVKLPHDITHASKLRGVVAPIERFLADIAGLGDRLGPLLVQLPASFALAPRVVDTFFAVLRRRFGGAVVCEPRHADWFGPVAERLFARYRIGRVGADPARVAGAGQPGGWLGDEATRGLAYFRWHGAPVVYRSSYPPERIAHWAAELKAWNERCDCWCVFDNTASGAAAPNALALAALSAAELR
jgi:uncharacterized protein YecE (DUF72 family)